MSELDQEIDTCNDQFVGIRGDEIIVAMPQQWMTKAEALRHAAWLVALADDNDEFPLVLAAIGDQWEPLPEGAALLEHWAAQLPRAEGLILRALAEAWPQPVPKAEVAERTGYTVTGGGFNNALGKLRTLQLISGSAELVADETLAQHTRGGIHA